MNKTTLYLPSELHRAIREASRRNGKSQAEMIREALWAYFNQHERPRPRSIGVIDDPDLHGADSEDWLRQNWRPD